MGRIPEDEVARIKREIALERVVAASGIELGPHGKDLVGRCPFHDDKMKWTPHFGPQVKVEPARTREQDNDEKSTGETQFSI